MTTPVLSAVELTDWDLVTAAQSGDTDAFGQLYERHIDTIHRYVQRRVTDRHQAQDFASETFLRALRGLHTVSQRDRPFAAWLVTIAGNLIRDHNKSSRQRTEIVGTGPPTISEQLRGWMFINETPDPADVVIDQATSIALAECMTRLTRDQCECIRLRFLRDLSIAETATVMGGRTEGAIKGLQQRAARKLASLMADSR